MANKYNDLLQGKDFDLLIENGDFVLGDGLEQEVATLLNLNQGELKNNPLLGPNLNAQLKGSSREQLERKVKLHLEMDGKSTNRIHYDGRIVTVDAQYN